MAEKIADMKTSDDVSPTVLGDAEKAPPKTDPQAPSATVSSKRQSISDLFTIFAAGAALISDGYQNSLMTMTNVLLKKEYKKQYTSAVSTRVSNALLVGEIFGQIVVGLTCDYLGRKFAIIVTTAMIVVGGILATAANGYTINGMFWMLTIARGIVGFGTGGEYPASSTSASEAANERTLKSRGPIFIMVTNLPLSFGGPLSVSIFLIVLSACQEKHFSTVWRVCFAIGVIFPLSVFYFRIRMLNSKLYRRGAIKHHVPYPLVLRYYWKSLIGTCGAWFCYGKISSVNAVTIINKNRFCNISQWCFQWRHHLQRRQRLVNQENGGVAITPRHLSTTRCFPWGFPLRSLGPQEHHDVRLFRLPRLRSHYRLRIRSDNQNHPPFCYLLWAHAELR